MIENAKMSKHWHMHIKDGFKKSSNMVHPLVRSTAQASRTSQPGQIRAAVRCRGREMKLCLRNVVVKL
ncbi:60S ribosomal protein L13 [Dissostichus eleginoides]|uniref:60S ribosomal protein L13 n=1 Tax=Dissostichus eleginoides TaxID=100907 RepID=A0AAD9C0G1_DISEL|nr:60S ribosomal protein L13 [Dissostichus eleginoides]